jgi:mannitol-specific phosphotransferase system IIBC component
MRWSEMLVEVRLSNRVSVFLVWDMRKKKEKKEKNRKKKKKKKEKKKKKKKKKRRKRKKEKRKVEVLNEYRSYIQKE